MLDNNLMCIRNLQLHSFVRYQSSSNAWNYFFETSNLILCSRGTRVLGMHEIISSKQVIWFCVQDGVLRQRFFRETRSLRTPYVTRTRWLVSFASLANIASNPVLPSMTIKFRRNKRLSPVRVMGSILAVDSRNLDEMNLSTLHMPTHGPLRFIVPTRKRL